MDYFKILLGALCLIIALCYQKYQKLTKNLPKPTFDLKEFWGKGAVSNYKEDSSVKFFTVAYDNDVRATGSPCKAHFSETIYLYSGD